MPDDIFKEHYDFITDHYESYYKNRFFGIDACDNLIENQEELKKNFFEAYDKYTKGEI